MGVLGLGAAARAQGEDTLLDRALLKIEHMRAGLSTLLMQQLILLGTFFVLPVYLQVVLGLDAFEDGKAPLPMSVTMLLALAGPRLAERFAPRGVARLGLVALVIGAFGLLGTVDVELDDWDFAVALAFFGAGVGLLLSQLGNVIMSSVPEEKANRPRAAGDGAEPRRVAGHGPDRLGAARRPDDRVRGADRDEPGAAGRGADADRRSRRGGRHRPGRPGPASRRRRAAAH